MPAMNSENLAVEIADRLRELGFTVRIKVSGPGHDFVATPPTGGAGLNVQIVESDAPISELRRVQLDLSQAGPKLLAQRHIPAGRAKRYRAMGLQFVDTGGNAWISVPGLMIHVEGRRAALEPLPGRDRPTRALRRAGLQLVFAMLTQPSLVGSSLREMAQASRISLGAAQGAIADLRQLGFVFVGEDKVRRLDHVAQLADDWLTHARTDLHPKISEIRMEGPPPDWWLDQNLRARGHAQLSGETALAKLGYPIRPTTTTLYADPPWHEIRRAARLKQGNESNVIIRERFWEPELVGDDQTVPPLLVYADALASDDSRQVEVAREMWHTDEDLRRFSPGGGPDSAGGVS